MPKSLREGQSAVVVLASSKTKFIDGRIAYVSSEGTTPKKVAIWLETWGREMSFEYFPAEGVWRCHEDSPDVPGVMYQGRGPTYLIEGL